MERLFVLLLVAAGCGDKPRAPDPKQFASMSAEAKCEATRPRAQPCVSELIAQQVATMVGDQALAKELSEAPSSSGDAEVHRVNCQASATYVDAVVACWTAPDCKAFAACVVEKDSLDLGAKPPSRE